MPVCDQQSTIGFIGPGAVGGTLAVALEQAGYRVVAVASRTWASAQGLAQRLMGCTAYASPQQVVDACELGFISTPDDAIGQVASDLTWRAGQGVVHLQGLCAQRRIDAKAIHSPEEVGADRLVHAVAAYDKFHCDLIVVDLGTATTSDTVSPDGAYLGGAISPGSTISIAVLAQHTSKLSRVEFANPGTVTGKHTVHAMQAGIYFGYVGLVDTVEQRRAEMGGNPLIVATGAWPLSSLKRQRPCKKSNPSCSWQG